MRTGMITMALVVMATATALAAAPEQRCESGKNDAAGRYFACLAKAQRVLVLNGDMARYDAAVAKCPVKLTDRWNALETYAVSAGTACPSEGDLEGVQAFMRFCQQSVADALGGGTLPSDCITCDGDLSACQEDLGTTEASLTGCTSNLGTCNTSLSSTQANLTSCNNELSSTNADLGTCNGNLTTCSGSLTTCNANYASCSGSLATVNSGTATAANVLSGKTFSSGAGLGVTGTMVNRGAVTITPWASAQTIAAGYHNGSGTVAGDADLVAANIKSGVDLFGVVGTLAGGGSAQVLKTGQTTSYGSGSDGDLQKGVSRSFTDNGDGTITDNATGLMWEKKSNDGGIHDLDNTYTWGMNSSPYTMNGTMVTTFLAALNADGGFAGYTDWRLPNRTELLTLTDIGAVQPTFNQFNTGCAPLCSVLTCSCTAWSTYWSSSTYQNGAMNAWFVEFGIGGMDTSSKINSNKVRAVRGGS